MADFFVLWSLSVAEAPNILQNNPAFRLRSMTGIFFVFVETRLIASVPDCALRLYRMLIFL